MNHLLEYQGFHARIEFDADEGILFGTILGIEDCITFEGESSDEICTAFHDAVDDYVEMCSKAGKIPMKHYKGSFNVRVSPDVHKSADLAARSSGISLNQFVERAIRTSLGL
ncbi:MAG: type II toxin-antitoxin system HicB family antitoxin [Saccharofermentanales bacterium]